MITHKRVQHTFFERNNGGADKLGEVRKKCRIGWASPPNQFGGTGRDLISINPYLVGSRRRQADSWIGWAVYVYET
jgi:hypothetical protein